MRQIRNVKGFIFAKRFERCSLAKQNLLRIKTFVYREYGCFEWPKFSSSELAANTKVKIAEIVMLIKEHVFLQECIVLLSMMSKVKLILAPVIDYEKLNLLHWIFKNSFRKQKKKVFLFKSGISYFEITVMIAFYALSLCPPLSFSLSLSLSLGLISPSLHLPLSHISFFLTFRFFLFTHNATYK